MSGPLGRLAFMREHRWVARRAPAYAFGELGAEQSARVDAHLAGCPACAAVVAGLRRLRGALRAMGRREPPPHLGRRVAERIRSEAAGDGTARAASVRQPADGGAVRDRSPPDEGTS